MLRDRLADQVGAYCIPVANGTLGLMAAVAALGLGRSSATGGGAAMPSFTFPATAQAAIWGGLRPCLVDVDATHWQLDPLLLERALRGPRDVDLVVAVSSFGTPPSGETRGRWEHACRTAGVPLIVDSAAAFGAVADDGVSIGAQGDLEVVSFHATKPFAIGEGGAVFTRSRELRERVEAAVNFGFGGDHVVTTTMGLNAKMSELHAATALAVLDGYEEVLKVRRQSAARIRTSAAAELGWQAGCALSTWQFVPALFPARRSVMQPSSRPRSAASRHASTTIRCT